MDSCDFSKSVDEFRHEVVQVEHQAHKVSERLQALCCQVESAKIVILRRRLEKRRVSLAYQAGFASVAQDGRKLGISLGAALVEGVLGGALCRDKWPAWNIGISSFNAAVRGLGETTWAVSLEKDFTVVPKDDISAGRIWVTWESLKHALDQLEREASQGVALGNVDSIISRLKAQKELVCLRSWVPEATWVEVKEP